MEKRKIYIYKSTYSIMIIRKLRFVGSSWVITIPAHVVSAYDLQDAKVSITIMSDGKLLITKLEEKPKDTKEIKECKQEWAKKKLEKYSNDSQTNRIINLRKEHLEK